MKKPVDKIRFKKHYYVDFNPFKYYGYRWFVYINGKKRKGYYIEYVILNNENAHVYVVKRIAHKSLYALQACHTLMGAKKFLLDKLYGPNPV